MSEHLSAGRYCVLCPRGGAGITALFGSLGVSFGRGSNSTKSTQQRIDGLIEYVVAIDVGVCSNVLLSSTLCP